VFWLALGVMLGTLFVLVKDLWLINSKFARERVENQGKSVSFFGLSPIGADVIEEGCRHPSWQYLKRRWLSVLSTVALAVGLIFITYWHV